MSPWIVFDRPTAEAVESNTGARAELRTPGGEQPASIVAMAAAAPGMSVALIPSRELEQVLVMRFTRPALPQLQTDSESTRVVPGGFLGLADEIVLENEPAPPKKWWQKILD